MILRESDMVLEMIRGIRQNIDELEERPVRHRTDGYQANLEHQYDQLQWWENELDEIVEPCIGSG